MKKGKINYQSYLPEKRRMTSRILFLSVLIVVILIALYLTIQPAEIGLSSAGISKQNILAVYGAIGKELCEGKLTDLRGKTYTQADIDELMNALGDSDGKVLKEFCTKPNPTPSQSPK